MPGDEDYILLTGTSNPALAKEIGRLLKHEVFEPISFFADGEVRVRIPENIRKRNVFVIQPTSNPANNNIMELMFMLDAARRASANEITAVVPYFGYSRQDRKEMPRVPVSASVVASMITGAGADRIVTVDIHSEQQQGFIKGPWDNLYGSFVLLPELKKILTSDDFVVASPDKGGVERATAFAKRLGALGIAIVFKHRDIDLHNTSEAMDFIGNINKKDVLLVDDLIDTGGTITNAANLLKSHGANRVFVAATHGVFSGNVIEKIEKSAIERVLITDTIAQPAKVAKHKKIQLVFVAPLVSHAINCIQTGESISKKLNP